MFERAEPRQLIIARRRRVALFYQWSMIYGRTVTRLRTAGDGWTLWAAAGRGQPRTPASNSANFRRSTTDKKQRERVIESIDTGDDRTLDNALSSTYRVLDAPLCNLVSRWPDYLHYASRWDPFNCPSGLTSCVKDNECVLHCSSFLSPLWQVFLW